MCCSQCRKEKFNPLDNENIELIGLCLLCEAIRAEHEEDIYWSKRELNEDKENENGIESETA